MFKRLASETDFRKQDFCFCPCLQREALLDRSDLTRSCSGFGLFLSLGWMNGWQLGSFVTGFCPFVRPCQPCQMPGVFVFVFRIDNCSAILQTHNPPRMNLTAQRYFSCRPVTPPRPLTRLLFERFTIKRPSH